MTRLSHRGAPRGADSAGDAVPIGIAGLRHTLCCLLLVPATGCIYLGPMPDLETNVAPVALATSHDTELPIEIGEGGERVYVLAQDDDGDELTFVWTLSEDGVVGTSIPVDKGSQLELAHDSHLDGQDLDCRVFDVEGNELRLTWQLEVL